MKHSGLYDLHHVLNTTRGFLQGKGYFIMDNGHSESVKSSGKEITFEWKAVRSVTDYVQFFFQVEIVILREVDVVVEQNDRKVRMQQGDIEVRFRTWMNKNYRQTFHGATKEFLRQTYEKYIIKQQLSSFEGKLNNDGDAFWDLIKKTLGGRTR